jgi:hypothetical protein
VQAPVKAPESCTSLNKNLALHPALTVVDGWGGFAGFGGFVFTHGHFGFHKKRAASVCMILAISLEARPRAGAIKATQATQATDLMEGKGPATFGRPGSVVGPQRPTPSWPLFSRPTPPPPRHYLPTTNRPVKIGFVCMLNFALFRPKSQCACD